MPIEKNLFMQYMSGIGSALHSGEDWTKAANAIFQQNQSAQSMSGLLGIFQKMMRGEMAEGVGMKMDGKSGLSFTVDKMNLDKLRGESGDLFGAGEGLSLGGTLPSVPTPQAPSGTPGNVPVPSMPNLPAGTPTTGAGVPVSGGGGHLETVQKLLNPSGSLPKISASQLAGLSTVDIMNALRGAIDIEKLDQQKVTDLSTMILQGARAESRRADVPYKDALTKEAIARVQKMNLPSDERTKAIKNYQFYLSDGGEKSFDEWMHDTTTDNWDDYRKAVEGGYSGEFQTWLEHMKSIGAGKNQGVTWTTATKELTKRFGKLDPTGMWAVTPELQYFHRMAQRTLDELRLEGVNPLTAINEAEDRARKQQEHIENRYQQYIDAAKQIRNSRERESKIEEIKSEYYGTYKYLPTEEVIR